jgi:hypothetical protein
MWVERPIPVMQLGLAISANSGVVAVAGLSGGGGDATDSTSTGSTADVAQGSTLAIFNVYGNTQFFAGCGATGFMAAPL